MNIIYQQNIFINEFNKYSLYKITKDEYKAINGL